MDVFLRHIKSSVVATSYLNPRWQGTLGQEWQKLKSRDHYQAASTTSTSMGNKLLWKAPKQLSKQKLSKQQKNTGIKHSDQVHNPRKFTAIKFSMRYWFPASHHRLFFHWKFHKAPVSRTQRSRPGAKKLSYNLFVDITTQSWEELLQW